MKERVCHCCGAKVPPGAGHEFAGEVLCDNCWEERTRVCDICGTRIWRDDDYGDSSIILCRDCFNRSYTNCCRCDELLRREDACYVDGEPYCSCCYEDYCASAAIKDYYYKPVPIFYGKGKRFLGVELEIDDGGEWNDNAASILAEANRRHELLYCKHDGSLNDGFELVSHPMTLQYHMAEMPWQDVLDKAQALGYRSHNANTCGLHVHVNRDSFGDTETEQEAVIGRILYFFEKNWEELLRFSRRTPLQLQQWAARYGYKDHPKEMLDHVKKGFVGKRYTCVNLQNKATIEFRIFRGTLKYNTFIATLQLVDRVCEVAMLRSDEDMRRLTWSEFVAGIAAPELVQYLKERCLYVNEPVESEAEI